MNDVSLLHNLGIIEETNKLRDFYGLLPFVVEGFLLQFWEQKNNIITSKAAEQTEEAIHMTVFVEVNIHTQCFLLFHADFQQNYLSMIIWLYQLDNYMWISHRKGFP